MVTQEIIEARDILRSFARTGEKRADIGGSPAMPFEQAMSNLAHGYLKSKAPMLLDYEVGFQLLDKNQEETKAVGISGFKVGHNWLYVPVFFIAGDLKGHELLYVKNQDLFVPLKEEWVNEFMSHTPSVLGKGVPRNLKEIGVIPPHLYQMSRSPNKFASAMDSMPDWAREIMPTMAYLKTTNPIKDPKYASVRDLPTFLKEAGKDVIKALLLSFKQFPKMAELFQEFHDFEIIADAIKEASTTAPGVGSTNCRMTSKGLRCSKNPGRMRKIKMPKPGKSVMPKSATGEPLDKDVNSVLEDKPLEIVTFDEVTNHGTGLYKLTDSQKRKLMRDKILIKDNRDETDNAYEVKTTLKLENPTESGLYNVLTKPGSLEKCLVIIGPYCTTHRKHFATVVNLNESKGGHSWINSHASNVWVSDCYTREEFKEWWDGLKDCNSLPSGGKHLIVTEGGQGTTPFKVDKTLGSTGGSKTYDVFFDDYARKGRADHLGPLSSSYDYGADNPRYYDGERICLTDKKGGELRATGGDLYVPAGCKILTLRKPTKREIEREKEQDCCEPIYHSGPPAIELGNQLDVDRILANKTASVKIYDHGSELDINNKRMPKLAGLIHLVRDYNLREKVARTLIKRAEQERSIRFWMLKKSDQYYDLQRSGPGVPEFPEPPVGYDPLTGNHVPTQHIGEYNVKIPDMSAHNTDPEIYRPINVQNPWDEGNNRSRPEPDYETQQMIMDAAMAGQQEIFDTSVIGSLLKVVRDDSMVDRYMGDLMKGMDRLGRILFLFYWHIEKFEQEYGKSDMVELEDGLRNAFEAMGDIVLFLKQRSLTLSQDDELSLDLDQVAAE